MHYSKHVYDIDLIAILNTISGSSGQIKFYSQDRQKEFFRQTKVAVETALDLDETAVDKLLLNNVPKVLCPASKNSVYQYWLGLQLSISNPQSIALILDYHWDNVRHEKWFLEHLEFRAFKSIIPNSFFDTEMQMEKISAWLRENKKQIRNFENAPTVKIEDEVINEVVETLSTYIENPIDQNRFLILLKEGKIQEPIPFKCNCNFIVLLFDKIRMQSKVAVSKKNLSVWITENFSFWDTEEARYRTHNPQSVAKILYGQKDISTEVKQRIKKLLNFS